MTFDELEVGRWYWFQLVSSQEDRVGQCGMLGGRKVISYRDCFWWPHEINNIAPAPSRADWERVIAAAREAEKSINVTAMNIEAERYKEQSGRLIRHNTTKDPWEGVPEMLCKTRDAIREALGKAGVAL